MPQAPRLLNEGGQWVLLEHGNKRLLSEAEVPDAKSYIDSFWQGYGQKTPGDLPSGWDETKFYDPTHTTPKYVAGRAMSRGNMADPTARKAAVDEMLGAFEGATFDDKDALYIPWLGPKGIDIFGGASHGEFRPQWLDLNVAAGTSVSPDKWKMTQMRDLLRPPDANTTMPVPGVAMPTTAMGDFAAPPEMEPPLPMRDLAAARAKRIGVVA